MGRWVAGANRRAVVFDRGLQVWRVGAEHRGCAGGDGSIMLGVISSGSASAFHPIHHVDREVGRAVDVFALDLRNDARSDRRGGGAG